MVVGKGLLILLTKQEEGGHVPLLMTEEKSKKIGLFVRLSLVGIDTSKNYSQTSSGNSRCPDSAIHLMPDRANWRPNPCDLCTYLFWASTQSL